MKNKWTRHQEAEELLKESVKTIEEDMKENDEEEKDKEISPTEAVLDSILVKGLSIIDKVLGRIDEKLDDEEFMKEVENNIIVNIKQVDWKIIAKNDKAKKEKDVLDEISRRG